MSEDTYEAMEAALELTRPGVERMCNVVQLRDYKRREENDADLVRLAREVMGLDTAPCEMPPVQPDYRAPEGDGA
jgi:hypothetical protein